MLATANGDYGQKQYTYDPAHNRTTLISTPSGGSAGTDTYSYGTSDNRLVLVSESSSHQRAMTYDAAGNVTYDNRSGGGYGYTYNAAGRMASMSINGVTQAEYEYNALGQQVVRRLTQAGQTIHSIYDLEGKRIEEYLFDPVASTSTLIREYVWLDGKPVAVIEGGVIYYVRADHIGRPVFATDGTAAVVWSASYQPFGGVHVSSGSPIDLRFPGQWFQAESGLHQNWMRDYDPTTGRYIEADPLGLVDGPSVYGYALQNPGRYVDPRGEQSISIPPLLSLPYPGGPTTRDQERMMKKLLGLFDPRPLARYCIDAVCSATAVCSTSSEKACDDQYEVDIAICRQLVSAKRKRACYAQATERLAACRAENGKPPFPYP
ncbi:MAG: RHS repeat-associated protein [Paracoccaceae bacterium]|jgi:RHS repeat-associated protein